MVYSVDFIRQLDLPVIEGGSSDFSGGKKVKNREIKRLNEKKVSCNCGAGFSMLSLHSSYIHTELVS